MEPKPEIDFDHFLGVDMRVGRIVAVEDFPKGAKARLEADDRLRRRHRAEEVGPDHQLHARAARGSLVVAVVNFPPRQVGPVRSEVLVLGALNDDEGVLILRPDGDAQPGDPIA